MRISETSNMGVNGTIKAEFVNKAGDTIPLIRRSNIITYSAADIMARLVGGDVSYIPKHIGFLYGADADPSLIDPDLLPISTRRNHPWSVISNNATALPVKNVLVAPLVLSPAWESTADVYTGNVVTVSSFTGAFLEYAFPTGGSSYAPGIESLPVDSIYFYHAILLNRREIGSSIIYTPFARVSLRDTVTGLFKAKPEGFELALYWTLKFT